VKKRRPRRRQERPAAPRGHLWLVPAVVVVTFLAFAPAPHNQFVDWDDVDNFTGNPSYRGLGWTQLKWMWTSALLGHYVPVTWMSLGMDYLVWGMNPAGYHLTSLLLHCAGAAVFALVALRLLSAPGVAADGEHALARPLAAAFAALLFAVHPLRAESVAWVTERRDVLSGLFFLLAIWAYLRDADVAPAAGSHWRMWYWVSLGCFVLALLAKAITVTLPLVLIVLDVYPLRQLGQPAGGWWSPAARRRWAEKVPFVLASAVVVAIAFRVAPSMMGMARIGVVERLAISAYGLVFHLWKTILPLGLAPFYALKTPVVPVSMPYLLCALVVGTITVLAVFWRRRWPALTAGWLVYVVTLLPVSGIFQNGPQITADRYSYLPSLAVAVIAAAGTLVAWRAWRQRWRRATFLVVPAVGALTLTILSALTWMQVGIWRDTERLWTYTVAVAPSSEAYEHLGYLRRQQRRWDEMNDYYRRAAALRPDSIDVQVNWGIALVQAGRLGEAIEHFRDALRIEPGSATPHYHWGNALLSAGSSEEAIVHFREAVRADPAAADAYNNWGRALAQQGKWQEAIAQYREALRIRPHSVPHYNWGNAAFAAGALEEAIQHYREAIRIDPNAAEVYNNWGRALAQQGKWEEAIVRYREALRIRPDYRVASANLEHALSQTDKTRSLRP
jgi:tetratricopeptide (TPR) repeat protein